MDNRFEMADWLFSWITEQYRIDWRFRRAATDIPAAVHDAYNSLILSIMQYRIDWRFRRAATDIPAAVHDAYNSLILSTMLMTWARR